EGKGSVTATQRLRAAYQSEPHGKLRRCRGDTGTCYIMPRSCLILCHRNETLESGLSSAREHRKRNFPVASPRRGSHVFAHERTYLSPELPGSNGRLDAPAALH